MAKGATWVLLAVIAIVGCDKKSKDAPGESAGSGSTDQPAAAIDGGRPVGREVTAVISDALQPRTAAPDAGVAVAVVEVDAGAAEPVAVVEVDAGAAEPVVVATADTDAGAAAPAVPAALKAGDKISAKWSDGYWYPAKIVAVNANGSFDIRYDDGTREKNQPKGKVKARKAKAKGGQSSSGGCSGGRTKCGSRCVDLQNDPNNCWSCGRQCPEACMGGSCVSNDYKYGQ